MLINFLSVINMQKYGGLFISACLFLCLTFNSTLPLYRHKAKATRKIYPNVSERYVLFERTKKMATNLENTLRRIKDSTQDFGKSIYDHLNIGIKNLANKDAVSEDAIRQYEELVIMKKHPYLDLKALEMRYSPLPSKNIRQSATISMDRYLPNEPGIHCDTVEDLLNVEIINRGLSGFAIPPLLVKHTESADSKLLNNNVLSKTNNKADEHNSIQMHPDRNILKNLKDDINVFMERKSSQ